MKTDSPNSSAKPVERGRNILRLTCFLCLILLVNAAIALFQLSQANEQHLADLKRLKRMTQAMEKARSAQVHLKKQVQEWKNILLRGHDHQQMVRHVGLFEQEEHQVAEDLNSLTVLAGGLDFVAASELEQLLQAHRDLGVRYRSALKEHHPEDTASSKRTDEKVRGIDREPTDQMDRVVAEMMGGVDVLLESAARKTRYGYEISRILCFGGSVAGVLIVLLLAWVSEKAPSKKYRYGN